MIQFFMLKLHLGGCMSPAPKFVLPITQEGMVYKIWDVVYKIVQNEYKIMIHFFMLKLHLGGGLHVTNPSNLNCRYAQEGMVYKIWDSVYKIVQNKYKIMIYFSLLKSVLGGGAVTCISKMGNFWAAALTAA